MRAGLLLLLTVLAAWPAGGARIGALAPSLQPASTTATVHASPRAPDDRAAPDTVLRRDLRRSSLLPPLGTDGTRLAAVRPSWAPGVDGPLEARLHTLATPPGEEPRPTVSLGLASLATSPLDAPPPPGLFDPLVRPPAPIVRPWGERFADRLRPDAPLRTFIALRALRGAPTAPPDPGQARVGLLAPDTAPAAGVPAPAEPGDTAATELGSFFDAWADLGMRVQARAEIEGDWNRFRPCESQLQGSCSARLLPQLSPDLLFDIDVAGTIADRVHVDVDFDQAREFEATNRINVFYEGQPDDVLQRIEVGDVTFALPPSRFVTQGLPAGNFGFQARGQLGPVDFQGVWAEQKGDLSSRVFRLEGVGNQRRFVQEDTIVWDDADYAKGQFFFLVPPEEIDRYPHIDVLSLDAGSAPASVSPGVDPVQLYRFEARPVTRQQVEGFIQADAILERGVETVTESGWFRYLQPGEDYFMHPSGLWVVLRNPLSRDEMLAATFVTAVGDTVGDYNPEELYSRGERPELRLLKGSRRTHQPGRPTWELEMRNVYRVSSAADVDPSSIEVTISLGERSAGRTFVRSQTGEDITYLRLLGLDRESPIDEVDRAVLYSPGRDVFQDEAAVQGSFLVFPTLEPFKRPPPLDALGLDEDDTAELLGPDANETIYDDPDPFERDNGGSFRLTVPFRRQSEGVITSFSLGALGVREGSERILFEDRRLVRGIDYEIDYDIGQVRLLEPEALFATRPDAELRASWEQQQLFRQAPVSVFGFSGRTGLGERGELNLIGLYRNEKTLVRRPTLGLEPGAVGLVGLSGRYTAGMEWLDRALAGVPGLRFAVPSTIEVEGEGALSIPDPNTQDEVFLDDFDASSERPLSLLARDWTRGSAPTFRDGAEDVLPATLDVESLYEIVWQHQWILEGPGGDSVGIQEGFLPRQDIDEQIRVAGSQLREPGLLLTLNPRQVTSGPRFASVTTTLSQRGTDLTKSEFLEFYVSGEEALTLVVDLGVVSEDALFATADGATSGVKANGVPWGLDLLDQEADPQRGEIWGDEADQRGVWGESCLGEPGRIYRRGDPRAVCTRNNGRQDSEDLDGDGTLGRAEKHLRYVVRLDGNSPFLARDQAETGTDFRLYRIPIEAVQAVEVGGPFTDADLRSVKHLRLTAVGSGAGSLTLARMRIVGSVWVKRTERGVLTGIVGDTVAPVGRVEVSPVSRLTEGEQYSSPPGVLEQLADPTSAFGGQGVEFNEKSLSLTFEDIDPGDRAEVYNRFPQRPRNFLEYREARLWVTARSGDLGRNRAVFFYLKVGTGPDNFYLYRTRLDMPPAGGAVATDDWLPERLVDVERWLDLRREAEEILIESPPGPGEGPVTVWSADSTQAVVLRDRGQAPDLANVRELAMGVWNRDQEPVSGEVWVDELRLGAPVRDGSLAGFVNLQFNAADVLETRATWSRRGAFFRQLEENPSYQTDRVFSLSSLLRLERFLPADWGVEVPVRFTLDDSDQDPVFLQDSDVRGNRLSSLRPIGTRRTRVSVGFRKSTPSANPLLSVLVDGLEANLSWFTSRTGTVTSRLESDGVEARVGYERRLDRRTVSAVPGFLEGVVRFLLPDAVAEDVIDAELRWTPERLSVGTGYRQADADIFRFDQITERPADSLAQATRAPRESLESAAEIAFRPFQPVEAAVTLLSTRDLLSPDEAVSDDRVQRLLGEERARVAGFDLGWETNRVLRTRFGFRPSFVSWLRHDLDWSTSYRSDRNASFVEERVQGADTTRLLERNASGERIVRGTFALDPAELVADAGAPAATGGGPGETEPEVVRAGPPLLLRLLSALRPLTANWIDGVTSRFNRDPVGPDAGYQLGLVGRDRFRFQDGDTASTVTDRSTWRFGSGVLLPAGVELGLAYAFTDIGTLDTRSDRTVHSETWPDLTLSTQLPDGIPGTPVDRVTLSAGWVEELRETSFGAERQQLRVQENRRVPVDVRVGWAGATLAYTGAFEDGVGVDPTGDTDRASTTHRLSLSSSFMPPAGLSDRLDRPVTLSLILSHVDESECRVARFRDDCVPFVDQLDRGLSLNLGTGVQGFEIGLQGSYTDRQSFIGVRQGSTQFQLGLFGQFVFEAGPARATPFE